MKPACIMRGWVQRIAETAAHLVTRDDRCKHVTPGAARHLADRKCCRHDRRTRMQRGIRMRVIEIQGMAERPIEQGRDRRRPALAVAENGGVTLAVERER